MSLARQASEGVAWTGAGKTVVQLVGVVVTLALARLLTPADFGLVGMVVVVTGFLAVFGEMGFATALVQRDEVGERHSSSVFWLNLLVGVALAALLYAAAPWIARFYAAPKVLWVVRVLAVEFVLAPLSMVQHAMLSRQMQFRTLALAEMAGVLLSSAVAMGMALAGLGVWALVGRTLASTIGEVLAMWALSRWRPSWVFDRAALRELFGYSANLFGFSTVNYWAGQIDDLLIGRFFGAGQLGLYGRAYSTMMMPVTEVGGVLARVMFPTFSKLQHDPAQTKQIYLKLVAVIGFVTFPVMFGLAVLAKPFILVLYGDQWVGAATVLSIYCLVGASHAIGSTVSWIYKSQGRTDWMFRWGLVASAVTIGAIVLGVRLGSIETVAACYAVATVGVLAYPRFAIPGRLIGLAPGEVFAAVQGPLGCAAFMAVAVWSLGWVLAPRVSTPVDLLVRTLVGALVYMLCSRLFSVRGLQEIRAAVRRMLLGSPSEPEPASK